MLDWTIPLRDFFNQGGPVLVVILVASMLLWYLIIERYWYFWFLSKLSLQDDAARWQQRSDKNSWYAMKIREDLLANFQIEANHNLLPIKTIIMVLPLLGLLGTVTGMISIFEVMNVFGNSNVRGFSEGISRALLPTTAGLVTSISGFYFSTDLNRRANKQLESYREQLTH